MASMTRGTALVPTVAGVVALTGQQGLANIPEATELTLTDLLITASDYMYDRLKSQGIDPTALTNAEIYERCVAWHFLSILAESGLFFGDDDTEQGARYLARAEAYCDAVTPETSDGEVASDTPVVGNINKYPLLRSKYHYNKRSTLR